MPTPLCRRAAQSWTACTPWSRRGGAERLRAGRTRALTPAIAAQAAPPELLGDAGATLGKLLLPRLSVRLAPRPASLEASRHGSQDGSERCRQTAAEAALSLVQRAPVAALALLPYAVPVLHERLVPVGAARPDASEARLAALARAASA